MVQASGSISANPALPYLGPKAHSAVVLRKVRLIEVVVV